VYVISEENHEGFIPHSYCAQFGSQLATLALNVKKKLPRGGNPGDTTLPPSMSMSPTRFVVFKICYFAIPFYTIIKVTFVLHLFEHIDMFSNLRPFGLYLKLNDN
jgi:hypothetical protein